MLIPSKFSGYRLGGRRVYPLGGDDEKQAATQTQISDIPDWAKPATQRVIGRTEALTQDKPYQSYGNWARSQGFDPSQVAGFTGMQQQSFRGAENLQPSQALGPAQGIAGAASMGALGAQYNPYQTGQFTGGAAAQYMSPFAMNALAPQMREAARQSDIQRNQQQAQAVGQGAFGGSRQAIVESERQRNLGQLQSDIMDRGLQQAYDRAQQQFNTEQQLREQSRQYGAGLGMQGFQTALQGAGLLGQLGGQQFGQQRDIIGLQNQLGTQQQQLEQARINANLQDYSAEQKYPYQQLEFMSNILRGTPMGTTQTLYQPGPSFGQQVGALGMGAYGLSQLGEKRAAGGGLMDAYAAGGSVTDERFVESAIEKLSDAQLQQEVQEATAAGDAPRLGILQKEMMRRSSVRGAQSPGAGLTALFSDQMADNVLPTEESMARGGIVAFQAGGNTEDDATAGVTGDPELYKQFLGRIPGAYQRIADYTPTTMPEGDWQTAYTRALAEEKKVAGPSPYDELRKEIAAQGKDRESSLAQGRGLAALQAAGAMLQGRGVVQGLGRAGSAFASSYGEALKADQAEKKALTTMRVNLADAERKERMGYHTAAVASADKARTAYENAQKNALTRDTALADLAVKGATAAKPGKPGAGVKVPEQLAAAEIEYAQNPTPENLKKVQALRSTASQTRTTISSSTSDVGPVRAGIYETQIDTNLTIKAGEAASEARRRAALNPAYLELKTKAEKEAYLDNAAETARRDFIRRSATPAAPAAPAPRVNANPSRPAANRLRFDMQGNQLP